VTLWPRSGRFLGLGMKHIRLLGPYEPLNPIVFDWLSYPRDPVERSKEAIEPERIANACNVVGRIVVQSKGQMQIELR
jgi:hypothetical protein